MRPHTGRVHRAHTAKTDVQVIDFVDEGNVALMRMWEKRKMGYRTMGYRMTDTLATMKLL